jgi:penicillin V acylase-like amidase (Ntn superfamily)
MTKFLVTCNNPRIASTKTQSIFCNKNVFYERQDSEKTNISWYQIEIFEFSRNKIRFKTLKTFENNPEVVKSQKIVKKEVTGH